ncbi:cell division topological specificity factor MinE [Roseivivax marinus]|jgi:cell division topological specificity factor|uniref:Cell division topological specificity factor n=1 Tax=Roseivivax marinus TaxID=1379903 RepID=W4HKC5_9RHOB|nr:cell division topological specificity factor MinE [Roseivivax marinus]ETW13179.1 cell division topological specificity factor MinE [Roseivivax marinus]UMA63322.1 cell division topological specificity factor MinE [Roseivivax marinus]SEK68644.1 cell division topological specificity factor MinE [Roseivivax marinus]
MSLFGISLKSRRPKTAQTAKDRLQILLAHERGRGSDSPDYLQDLQRDIVQAVRKYVDIGLDDVDVRMDRSNDISSLEINVEIPSAAAKSAKKS